VITIKVSDKEVDSDFIDPVEMIGFDYGTIFQQYHNGKPCKDYYISCGHAEKSVIHIWYNEEDEYNLSTDDIKSLKELVDAVRVKEINATIEIDLIIGE
jgi:hypothetical protein